MQAPTKPIFPSAAFLKDAAAKDAERKRQVESSRNLPDSGQEQPKLGKVVYPASNELTPSQKERVANIQLVQSSVAVLGSIGGLIYAKKTGGGFWRYVGYWIAGGLVAGIPAMLIATPFKNKILKESEIK